MIAIVPRVFFLALLLSGAISHAEIEYRGINLSAAAFGHYSDFDAAPNHLPGIYNIDYAYPEHSDIDYFRGLGMNTFRIPFRWERIQPTLGGPLDTAELARLSDVVNYATGLGASVILDLHNYARYITPTQVDVLGVDIPASSLANVWSQLADDFKSNDRVIFGLMNEPHDTTSENVVSFTNAALAAVRGTGATNLVLVQGNGYSGGHSWLQDWYGTSNSTAMLSIQSDANLAFEIHQYVDNNAGFDSDYSGLTDNVESATVVPEKLAGFTDWLRANGLRGFLGELGTPASPLGVEAMANGIDFVENNDDVWLGWALWSGGPWWDAGDDARYPLSLNPYEDGTEAPQLAALETYLNPVPEPSTWMLCAAAALFFLLRMRRTLRG